MIAEIDYDIAIVGGGLAGLTLAIQCSNHGYKVILFEKEQYPFHKVCGEYISNESRSFLERLGVPLNDWMLPNINNLLLSDVSGNIYDFNLPSGGFGVSRFKLDHSLYLLALAKGVDVVTGSKVTDIQYQTEKFFITSPNKNTTAALCIAGYGKRSNLDIKLRRSFISKKPGKLNNYIAVKYHVRYQQPKNVIALHNFANGYCGISAIEDDKCCLCYLTTAHNLQMNNHSITEMEQNVLWQNPHLKKIFSSAEFLYRAPLAISQVNFINKSQVHDHILMMGDAAGMITPLCGNGMSMALHACKLAFECIDEFLKQNISRQQMERQYAKKWKHQFAKRLFTGRMVQQFFGNIITTGMFLKSMKALPWLAQKLIQASHGKPF